MFLIYGTMAFAILQRTQTLGVLRDARRVTRRRSCRRFCWETAGIAAVATALGLLLGHLLAIGLVGLVLRTIGDSVVQRCRRRRRSRRRGSTCKARRSASSRR